MTEREAIDLLQRAGVPNAPGDVRRLRQWADSDEAFLAAIKRRAAREPLSHITERRSFWKSDFRVTSDVLDPRPETERLIEVALDEPFQRVLDLGTGSGCILISLLLEQPDARGVGTDMSEQAVLIAGENAATLGVADRITLPLSDWYDDIGGRFDLIVSNPPYIAAAEMPDLAPEVRDYEPRMALTDEGDGLSAYRAITAGAPNHLTPGGRLIVEIGPTQSEPVQALFRATGLDNVETHTDLDGRDRVVSGRLPK